MPISYTSGATNTFGGVNWPAGTLRFAAVIVDEPAVVVPTVEGAHEIVIRTCALAIHVALEMSADQIALVLVAVRQTA